MLTSNELDLLFIRSREAGADKESTRPQTEQGEEGGTRQAGDVDPLADPAPRVVAFFIPPAGAAELELCRLTALIKKRADTQRNAQRARTDAY